MNIGRGLKRREKINRSPLTKRAKTFLKEERDELSKSGSNYLAELSKKMGIDVSRKLDIERAIFSRV